MTKNFINVWVFHPYATPPIMNGLTRPFHFATNMKEKGYNTTIFTSSYLHFSDYNLITDKKLFLELEHSEVPFVFVNTPSSAKGYLARIKNMISFCFRLFEVTNKLISSGNKPDIIYGSSPHPLALLASIKIAKKLRVPCICEVRDLWPEAIFAHGILKEKSFLGKLLIAGEHWLYKKSDALVFLKEGDVDYLKERKWTTNYGGKINLSKCFYINNGVDLKVFEEHKHKYQVHDIDLENDKFKVIYTGAIRPTNNVGNILDAAKLLKNYNDITFLIYGDGSELDSLKKTCRRRKSY